MLPYQERVVKEEAEVREKLSKLLAFFKSSTFAELPEAERVRLRNQARFMFGYADVLLDRIAAFEG